MLEQRLREVLGDIEPEAALHFPPALQLVEELGFALHAEAGEAVQLACSRGLPEVGEGMDLELVIEGPCPLGPDARNIGQLDEACRQAGLRLVENSEMLGIDELRDLACEIGADAGELSEILAAGDELGGAARKVLDRSRGPAVRANAERIGTFDLEQIGEVIESGRNLGVVNRHWASSFLVGLPLSPAANCPTCLDQDQAADGASWQRRDHPCLRDRSGTFLGRRPAAPQDRKSVV